MDCSTSGFPVLHHFPELAQIHIYRVGDAIQPSSVIPFSSCLQPFPTSGSFLMTWLFASGGQRMGTWASVPPMNIQDWFPLGLTGLISLQSKGLSGYHTLFQTTLHFRQLSLVFNMGLSSHQIEAFNAGKGEWKTRILEPQAEMEQDPMVLANQPQPLPLPAMSSACVLSVEKI